MSTCWALDPNDPSRHCVLPWNHEPVSPLDAHAYGRNPQRVEMPLAPRSPLLSRPRTEKQDSDEYRTPRALYDKLDRIFGPFTLDVAASQSNHLCAEYLTKEHDAPSLHVGTHRCWNNFPYSRGNPERFMGWALAEVLRSAPLFCNLGPAYTAEGWWQRHVERKGLQSMAVWEGIEEGMRFTWRSFLDDVAVGVHFIDGRVPFAEGDQPEEEAGPARYSSAVVVYRRLR
jgi:phage N-6-adenine-methyltransferase